jgi:polysaccharide deacetylase family protein (PEP-CTERM system associated)
MTSSAAAGQPIVNAMSVDVEEHFQVQALADVVAREDWPSRPSRVSVSTGRVLDLFAKAGIKATFFTLGWVARTQPALVRRIVAEGHELGSHGMEHVQAHTQTPEQFRADVRATKRILEDVSGQAVRGYRAATFSIGASNLWAFDVLAEEGHVYSSSVNPIRHDLYGMPDAPRFAFRPRADQALVEIPITTVRIGSRNLPCGGGGFFRLLPYIWSRWAIGRVNAADRKSGIFYFHPWEVDAGQPREQGLSAKSRFRHYTNLGRMEAKLERLLSDFRWDRMDRVFAAEIAGASLTARLSAADRPRAAVS